MSTEVADATTTKPLIGDYASGGLIYSSGWVEAPSVVEVIEPATGAVLGHAGVGDAAGVDRAAAAAARAQRAWATAPAPERAAVLERAADLLGRHQPELERWIIRDTRASWPGSSASSARASRRAPAW
jgi:benzaldehyde dehydrogenase (NAD)